MQRPDPLNDVRASWRHRLAALRPGTRFVLDARHRTSVAGVST
jgi:hypothetical protein